MSKATARVIAFAANPPAGVTVMPVAHRMLKTDGHWWSRHGKDVVADGQGELSGVPFDDMERGDPVVLCIKRTMHYQGRPSVTYEDWLPAVCVVTGEKRTFESLKTPGVRWRQDREISTHFEVWRIPYIWHPIVFMLTGGYESREAVERAMEGL